MGSKFTPAVTVDCRQPSQHTSSHFQHSASSVFIMPPSAVPIPTVKDKRRMKTRDPPGVPTGAQRSTREIFNTLYRMKMHELHGSAPSNEDYPLYTELVNSIKDNIREFLYNTMKLRSGEEKYGSVKLKYADKFRELKRMLSGKYNILAAAQSHWVASYLIKEVMQRDRKAMAEAARRGAKNRQNAAENGNSSNAPTTVPNASSTATVVPGALHVATTTALPALPSASPDSVPVHGGDNSHRISTGNDHGVDEVRAVHHIQNPGRSPIQSNKKPTHRVSQPSEDDDNGSHGEHQDNISAPVCSNHHEESLKVRMEESEDSGCHLQQRRKPRDHMRSSRRAVKRANAYISEDDSDSEPAIHPAGSSSRLTNDGDANQHRFSSSRKRYRERKTRARNLSEQEDSDSESTKDMVGHHRKVARTSRNSARGRSAFRAPRKTRKSSFLPVASAAYLNSST
eukprot:TRINITY_DN542_c0_g1_i1.p2 TRINITY_DN542_c0_g1~~TRINITY_DN542_c0_g1_i1.p2  ORF type:complete len:455 (-),score=56.06 TRINITY_DN542_c0_g1_i1:403-1767(-)